MAPSDHSKVSSTQNKGVSFFSCLAQGVQFYICMFGLSHSFSNNSNMIILVGIQHLHENGKLILRLSSRVYILFNRTFLAAPHCFIHVRQS